MEEDQDPPDLPFISAELIEYLETVLPPFLPKLTIEERKLWSEVGKRQLLEHLRDLHKNQRN